MPIEEEQIARELSDYVERRLQTRDYALQSRDVMAASSDRRMPPVRGVALFVGSLTVAVAVGLGIAALAPDDPPITGASPSGSSIGQTPSASDMPSPNGSTLSPSSDVAASVAPAPLPISDCPLIAPSVLPDGSPPGEPRASSEFPDQPVVEWGAGSARVIQFAGHRSSFDPTSTDGSPTNGEFTEIRGNRALVLAEDDPAMGPRLGLPSIGWLLDGCPYILYLPSGTSPGQMLEYAEDF